MTEIMMIAAVAKNGVIGADNDMPWKLSSDLKRFKALTVGKPVVMGRKTFLSFGGKPLPGRPHIVISRDPDYAVEGAGTATSLDVALEQARAMAKETGVDQIAVIGGGQIYAQAMPFAGRLEITEVDAAPEGDTLFPEIDESEWTETERVPGVRTDRDSTDFTYVTYLRKPDFS